MDIARCGNCRFYMEDAKVCREGPPTPVLVGMQQGLAGTQPRPVISSYFPPMDPGGWCGKHEVNDG